MSGKSNSRSIHWDDGASDVGEEYTTQGDQEPHSKSGLEDYSPENLWGPNHHPLRGDMDPGPTDQPEDFGLGGQAPDLPSMPLDLDLFCKTSLENGNNLRRDEEPEGMFHYGYDPPSQDWAGEDQLCQEEEDADWEQRNSVSSPDHRGSSAQSSSVPKRLQYRPRDNIAVGGTRDLEASNEIHRQQYTYLRQTRQRAPQTALNLGQGEWEPRDAPSNINHISHPPVARGSTAKPSDQLQLEGGFVRETGRDELGRHEYTRTARSQGPRGHLTLDKSLSLSHETSKHDHVAFEATARPEKVRPGPDNLSLADGGRDFASTNGVYGTNARVEKPQRIRSSMYQDNMKVGEGQLEVESTHHTSFQRMDLRSEDLRPKPTWYKQPRMTMTVAGEITRG